MVIKLSRLIWGLYLIKFISSVIENNLYTCEELIAIIGFENANSEIDYWGNSQAVEILKIVESWGNWPDKEIEEKLR